MNDSFAYYRLPGECEYVEVRSSAAARVLKDISEAGSAPGFIIAPFSASSSTAIVLIPADEVSSHPVPPNDSLTVSKLLVKGADSRSTKHSAEKSEETGPIDSQEFTNYQKVFTSFHSAVCNGEFRKLVLSRSKDIVFEETADLKELFLEACNLYPHLMVMLHHTDISGTWLVATPEPLLEYMNGVFHTVALAGTIDAESVDAEILTKGTDIWDTKNRNEQIVVEQFITGTLKPLANGMRKEGPYTSRAGHLLHLKTDISFRAPENSIGQIVSALHPTPAVCGLPQQEAREFILRNEAHQRKYYSGYAGPAGINGQTRLYVSLRCAEFPNAAASSNVKDSLSADYAELYAGGGIMSGSNCQSEFEETENKMQTIMKCLDICKIRKQIEHVQQ